MKLLIALFLAITLTGCGAVRGVMQDEYTDEAEFIAAFDIEMEYWNVIAPDRVASLREKALTVYRDFEAQGLTFDDDALRAWIIQRIVQ